MSRSRTWFAALCASLWVGCSPFPAEPDFVLFEPDVTRDQLGAPGPLGAACAEVMAPARATDVVQMMVCWPADSVGDLAPSGPFPPMVFVHGGLVEVERYLWLLGHWASRGYVVVAPRHKLDLALIESGNATLALDWLLKADAAEGVLRGAVSLQNGAGVAGHSLGAVVAAMSWADESRFSTLTLLAGFPAESTDVQARAGQPVLSISGQRDLLSTPGEVREGFERFSPPRWLGLVQGMHHYAWVDANSSDDLRADGTPTRPVEALRADAMVLVDAFIDTHLKGSSTAYKLLNSESFAGVEVQR